VNSFNRLLRASVLVAYHHVSSNRRSFVDPALTTESDLLRLRLTHRSIAALKPAAKRYEVWDEIVPGFGVRVDQARKSFVVVKRFPGAKHPTRRTIGHYGIMGLADARDTARNMICLITRGIDPAEELRRTRQTEESNRASQRTTLQNI
jgi:hypothetical protein